MEKYPLYDSFFKATYNLFYTAIERVEIFYANMCNQQEELQGTEEWWQQGYI